MRKSIQLLQRNTADIHDWICVFTPVLMVLSFYMVQTADFVYLHAVVIVSYACKIIAHGL